MNKIGVKRGKTESGYTTESIRYKAVRCEGCPLRCLCFNGKSDRIIEVNHTLNEYKRKAKERLTSKDGIRYRRQRCIEPEVVFGQMKANMQYKRFRHFGKNKVTMDFAFFAIAFNIKKMCSQAAKQDKNAKKTPYSAPLGHICRILLPENRDFWKKQQKSAA